MGELFGAAPELDYPLRLQLLKENRVALWDVVHACHRPGSLDSAISEAGMETNDFSGFFNTHPRISHVVFNGQKAASLFKKKVSPGLDVDVEYLVMPSTSPANAASSYSAKLGKWSVLKDLAAR